MSRLYHSTRSLYIAYQRLRRWLQFQFSVLLPFFFRFTLVLQFDDRINFSFTSVSQPFLCIDTLTPAPIATSLTIVTHGVFIKNSSNIQILEMWASSSKRYTCLTPEFQIEQFESLSLSLKTNSHLQYNHSVACFPYLTSQFGHFVGDCLGSILFFSSNPTLRNNLPIFVTPPSREWSSFLELLAIPDSLQLVDPSSITNKIISINSPSCILPKFSSFHNLQLASFYVGSYLDKFADLFPAKHLLPSKVFLTTDRPDRITNLEKLKEALSTHGFTLLTPGVTALPDLLFMLRHADVLLCEQGSIHQNVLISRSSPYTLIISNSALSQTKYEASCGSLYTSFHSHLARFFVCVDEVDHRNLHPYSRPVHVDIDKLLEFLDV